MSAAANKQLGELIFVAFRGLAEVETGKPHIGHGASVLLNFGVAVGVSKAWLSAGSNTTQLAALGYDAEGFMQCLHSAEATISAVGTALHDKTAQPKDLLPQLQKELQSVGVALTSFAPPSACNNPLCSNSTKPSEAALVQSKTSRCSACRAARYCGKACQVSHWKQHKHVCKRLAAAARAAAAAAAVGSGAGGVGV